MRAVWDPKEEFPLYTFARQPQTFPDVLVRRHGQDPAFGIELKGWYLLAKERAPTFRYRTSPLACTEWDLIVVVPWLLSEVISGTPRVLRPYIESAQHAAEYRNYWWQHIRETAGSPDIALAEDIAPYPAKSDRILDKAMDDAGGNFGRLARTGIMDNYMQEMLDEPVAGIAARYWLEFFNLFREQASSEEIRAALDGLKRRAGRARRSDPESSAQQIVAALLEALTGDAD